MDHTDNKVKGAIIAKEMLGYDARFLFVYPNIDLILNIYLKTILKPNLATT